MTQPTTGPVLLIRPGERNDTDAAALKAHNIAVEIDPYLVVAPCDDGDAALRATELLARIRDDADWFVVTSANAVDALTRLTSRDAMADAFHTGTLRGMRIAAVGNATANALHAVARLCVHRPAQATADALADLVTRLSPRATVVFPQGDQALPTLQDRFTTAGWRIHQAVVYTTMTVEDPPVSVDALRRGAFRCVVLRSPTAVRALHQYSPHLPPTTTLVCGGPTTAKEAHRLFSVPITTSSHPDPATVAETVLTVLATGLSNP